MGECRIMVQIPHRHNMLTPYRGPGELWCEEHRCDLVYDADKCIIGIIEVLERALVRNND